MKTLATLIRIRASGTTGRPPVGLQRRLLEPVAPPVRARWDAGRFESAPVSERRGAAVRAECLPESRKATV